MKNEDVRSFHEQGVSQIGETDEIEESFRAISENAPMSENDNQIIDRKEFKEAWRVKA